MLLRPTLSFSIGMNEILLTSRSLTYEDQDVCVFLLLILPSEEGKEAPQLRAVNKARPLLTGVTVVRHIRLVPRPISAKGS
jgi:hypothetical protein